jgi:hypothetical protein
MSIWLSARERARTRPAETGDASPIPTQVVSNGEWTPGPQTPAQRRVAHEIREGGAAAARRLGMDRRAFLRTGAGMALAFLAMNRVYGALFDVDPAEAADPEAAAARQQGLAGQLVVDAQLHFIRDDYDWQGLLALGQFALDQGWNPELRREGISFRRYKFENFVKEVFLDSDTRIGLLSGAPSDDPGNWVLGNDQIAEARRIVNGLAGSRRLLCHGIMTPGRPGWLEDLDRVRETLKPDSWKGYTVGDPLAPSKYPYRLDDERLMYPAYAKMAAGGIPIVCIHKGLIPQDYAAHFPAWPYAMVDDVGKAARDWPQLTFVIYHAGLKPLLTPPDASLAQFERSGRMDWVTDLAEIPERYGVTNVYAELGTAFATSCVTHPRHAAALLGTLIRGMGVERVLWGTDSVWYGSPQWQIEALRRLEIPEDMRRQHGFAALGPATGPVKGAILAGNAVRLYGLDTAAARADGDRLAALKRDYEAAGAARSNLAYGFIHRGATGVARG